MAREGLQFSFSFILSLISVFINVMKCRCYFLLLHSVGVVGVVELVSFRAAERCQMSAEDVTLLDYEELAAFGGEV